MAGIETRVARVAEALLAERQFVAPVDVLIGLGWLAESNVDRWTKGRVTSLDRCLCVDATKADQALDALRNWALAHGLQGWPTDYRELRFTAAGDPAAEDAFRTRWAANDGPAPAPPPTRSRDSPCSPPTVPGPVPPAASPATASVRHVDSDYDDLLMSGVDRDDARHRVRGRVDRILDAWSDGVTVLDD